MTRETQAKGFVRLGSLPPKHRPRPSGTQAAWSQDKAGVREMQTRRTNLDHHQEGSSPEAELIVLALSKGQRLKEHTLRLIRDTLELRGVTLEEFVADVRPHFRNNILNPSGFLIDRARRFHQLSRPAVVPVSSKSVQVAATAVCGVCKGQKFVLTEKDIEPCPECSTAEFRTNWEIKQAERARKIRASVLVSRPKTSAE